MLELSEFLKKFGIWLYRFRLHRYCLNRQQSTVNSQQLTVNIIPVQPELILLPARRLTFRRRDFPSFHKLLKAAQIVGNLLFGSFAK
jgi:hypothetical protein